MKRLFIIIVAFLSVPSCELYAQSPLINEWMDAVTELTGSFMDNPYHHSNTVKIYELTQRFKKTTDEVYTEAHLSDHPKASIDLAYLKNVKEILKCLDFITSQIAGYSRGGIDALEWETTFHPIMTAFGWTWKVINSTEEIVLYEYHKDNFNMVLARNIMPKKESGDYNAVAYACDSWDAKLKMATYGVRRIVFGGDYQFVTYGDDENKYNTISKVISKKGDSLDVLK